MGGIGRRPVLRAHRAHTPAAWCPAESPSFGFFSLDVLFGAFCHVLKYALRVRGQRASEDRVVWTHSAPACPCSHRWCHEGVAGRRDLCRGRRSLLPEGVLEADSVGPRHAHFAVAVRSRLCTPVPRRLSWPGLSPQPVARQGRKGGLGEASDQTRRETAGQSFLSTFGFGRKFRSLLLFSFGDSDIFLTDFSIAHAHGRIPSTALVTLTLLCCPKFHCVFDVKMSIRTQIYACARACAPLLPLLLCL